VLLQGKVARVEELPESTTVSGGKSACPCFTKDESDDLKEELRDVNGLGTEVEDLGTEGEGSQLLSQSNSRTREKTTNLTENGGEASQTDSDKVHSEGVDDHVGVIFEGHASSRDIFSSLYDERREVRKLFGSRNGEDMNQLTSIGRSFPLAMISLAAT